MSPSPYIRFPYRIFLIFLIFLNHIPLHAAHCHREGLLCTVTYSLHFQYISHHHIPSFPYCEGLYSPLCPLFDSVPHPPITSISKNVLIHYILGEPITIQIKTMPYGQNSPTTTSTDPIFEIFPGYQLQFSSFGTEAGFRGSVLRQESPGALGFWVSSLFVELFTSCCWEHSSSSSSGNIFLSLGLKFPFGLVWWHELRGESPVQCVSHGPLGG